MATQYILVYYSSKLNVTLLRFYRGNKTYYQALGIGASLDQSDKIFVSIKKKYPNGYVFDGMGDSSLNQCDIFAYTVAQQVTGIYPRENWEKVYNLNSLKLGGFIGKNRVLWDQWSTKSAYESCLVFVMKKT